MNIKDTSVTNAIVVGMKFKTSSSAEYKYLHPATNYTVMAFDRPTNTVILRAERINKGELTQTINSLQLITDWGRVGINDLVYRKEEV